MTIVSGTTQLRLLTAVLRFIETRARKAAEAIARAEDANIERIQELNRQAADLRDANKALVKAEQTASALARNIAGLTK